MHELWSGLPDAVRNELRDRLGADPTVAPISLGRASDFAAVLTGLHGRVFARLVPRLLWRVETDGWLVLGFEYAVGRHPDLGFGSPDLPALATTMNEMVGALTPSPLPRIPRFADRLRAYLDSETAEALHGDTLVHTDASPSNYLLTADGCRVVDWGWPARGPAWADAALFLPRLVDAGHSPAEAAGWAASVPAFALADPRAVSTLLEAFARLWEERAATMPHCSRQASAARAWIAHQSGATLLGR